MPPSAIGWSSGQHLEYFTIFWNSLEALAALISGFIAGSVALVAFGLDSLIEVTSGAALLWRLHQDKNTLRRESAERLTLRIVGSCFLVLSAYIAYDSLAALLRREAPGEELARHRDRCSFADRDAYAFPSHETRGCRPRQCRDGCRRPPNRLLHVFVSYLTRWSAPQRALRAVVGRSCGRFGNGPNHCQRGNLRVAGQVLLQQLPLIKRMLDSPRAWRIASGFRAVFAGLPEFGTL